MKEGRLTPDYIFEVSWEVCNKVGGIHTVLSTRAKSLQTSNKDRILFIGPDLNDRNSAFTEVSSLLAPWRKQAAKEGLKIRVGRWEVPGRPIVILVDFAEYYSNKYQIYTDLWSWFGVDSTTSFPSLTFSHAQPEPKRPTPAAANFARNSPNEPKAAVIARARSPAGSPPPPFFIRDQNKRWL